MITHFSKFLPDFLSTFSTDLIIIEQINLIFLKEFRGIKICIFAAY